MDTYLRFKELIKSLDHYPSHSELMYKFGFRREDLSFIDLGKRADPEYVKTGLPGENGNEVTYWNHKDMMDRFTGSQELIQNSPMNQFADFRESELLNGFVFSEIESSLSIEGVRSTRARIEQINRTDYSELSETNDIIVKNMLLGYDFVKNHDITEETIHELYEILSRNCLSPDDRLPKGGYYRDDEVHIVDSASAVVDRGVSWSLLPRLMGELLRYMAEEKSYEGHLVASHVIHFYLVYLHPYFDYNGRMARVLSFWYNLRHAPSLSLLLVSEAINNKAHKNGYYAAISSSRAMNNDITGFLEYLSSIVLTYTKAYINFFELQKKLKNRGRILNRSTELALKQVLTMERTEEGFFDWKDFRDQTNDDFSKVQYLKLLNALADLNILQTREVKKAKLFRLNREEWDLF